MRIREKVLYDAGHIKMTDRPRLERNAAAHGGNVLADIDFLEQNVETQPQEVIRACQEGFEQLYALPFAAREQIWESKNDDRLIALLNLRANIRKCNPWKQTMGYDFGNCNAILKSWYFEPLSWHEPETVASVNEILTRSNEWNFLLPVPHS